MDIYTYRNRRYCHIKKKVKKHQECLSTSFSDIINAVPVRTLRIPPNHDPFPYRITEQPKFQPWSSYDSEKDSLPIQLRDPPQEQRKQRKPSNGHNDNDSLVSSAETHERKCYKEAGHSIMGSDEHWCTIISCPSETLTPT